MKKQMKQMSIISSLLWATAIIAAAIMKAPVFYTVILLPLLAFFPWVQSKQFVAVLILAQGVVRNLTSYRAGYSVRTSRATAANTAKDRPPTIATNARRKERPTVHPARVAGWGGGA